MSSHGTESIWDFSGKLIILWIILNGFYMLLNIIGDHVATHHESSALLVVVTVLTFAMAIIAFIWSLKKQNQYSKVRFNVGYRCLWVVFGIIGTFILPMIAVIPEIILRASVISKNQQMINTASNSKPGAIYLFLVAGIAGPIIEEFLNRFLIIGPNPRDNYYITKSAYRTRIIISILVFTLLHMLPQLENIDNLLSLEQFLLNSLPYLVMSIVLSYVYVHTQDIRVSIFTHMGHNLITSIPQLLMFI